MRFASFAELIGYYAERTPDAPALRYDSGGLQTMTYAQLAETVERRAGKLKASGKTCLGIFADGSLACVTEIFAAVRAGMQVVLLDDSVPMAILRGILPYADVDMLWGDADLCEELSENLAGGVHGGAGRILFFTSGTTERSKAVVLTERSLCSSAWNGSSLLPLYPEDTLLCMLPLGHVFGFVCGLLWGLSNGACVALGRGARHYGDDCAFFKPTAISVVPLLLGFLLGRDLLNEELRLILVGAGDCPKALLEGVRARGVRVSFGYGLTETSSGVALSLGDDPYAMTICPDDTVWLAPDGEIQIKGPTCMMKGYYKCPEETNAVLVGGVLNTGDLGEIDELGRLRVTGRKKEIIVLPDGTKLFLPEAEAELAALLGPGDFALALDGDRVVLIVSGDKREDREILDAIAPYQSTRPRAQCVTAVVRRSEPLPRTATGKLRRWALNTPTARS